MTSPAFIRFACPDCAGKFRWPFGEAPPLYCPLCSAYVGEDEPAEFTPKAPMIRKAENAIPDKLYRNMEKGSITRADAAYEMAGGSRGDYNHMHMTNMRDNMREGDVAAMPTTNPVQRFMQQNASQAPIGIQGVQTAQGYAAAAHSDGVFPYAGAGAAGKIQEFHMSSARAMALRGEIARG